MEYSTLVQDPQNPVPAQQPAESRKRALETEMEENSYFKMRSVVNEMRPQVLEVLRTPDFRNCNAAKEVLEKLNTLMELYRQMAAETRSITKPKIARENHTFSVEHEAVQKPQEPLQNGKQQAVVVENEGHIIGGSAFGWNFITSPGKEPLYYGRTKETFRAAQAASTQDA